MHVCMSLQCMSLSTLSTLISSLKCMYVSLGMYEAVGKPEIDEHMPFDELPTVPITIQREEMKKLFDHVEPSYHRRRRHHHSLESAGEN